jgi:hypothetical protein
VHVDTPLSHVVQDLLVRLDDELHTLVDGLEVAVGDDDCDLRRIKHEVVSARKESEQGQDESQTDLEQTIRRQIESSHLAVDPNERSVLLGEDLLVGEGQSGRGRHVCRFGIEVVVRVDESVRRGDQRWGLSRWAEASKGEGVRARSKSLVLDRKW